MTKRVYSTLPVDLAAVAEISGVLFDDANKQWLRLVAFTAGCTALSVGRLLNDSSPGGNFFLGHSPDEAQNGHNTLIRDHIALLREEILSMLYKKNKALLKQMLHPTEGLHLHQIATIDWEIKFQFLSMIEVSDLWTSLVKKGKIEKKYASDLVENLLHLSDRCWLTIEGVAYSRPERIFPFSMFHVFKAQITSEALPGARDRLLNGINQGAAGIAAYLADPKVLGPAIGVAALCGCTTMFRTSLCTHIADL
jgi:hypothetical protein